ncbi:hypothetical protein BP5796_05031 [Coleophoma crateriformis]|uniref:DUF4267 domain-containing protein n=1 Tax=Coleophoma crateriformis TaxID=565419 RepID=A0A3D8S200_9HELO|nr:hypothetical protein BP5796_05031 [Coleophoma crateriformis]
MSILSSQSPLLPRIAAGVGAIPLLIGINGLLRPRALFASADFPTPTTPESQRLADAMMRLTAARNIVIGLTSSAIWYRGDRKLLGWAMMILSVFPAIDGAVSLDLIGGGLRHHLPVVPVALGLGAGLLGWLG